MINGNYFKACQITRSTVQQSPLSLWCYSKGLELKTSPSDLVLFLWSYLWCTNFSFNMLLLLVLPSPTLSRTRDSNFNDSYLLYHLTGLYIPAVNSSKKKENLLKHLSCAAHLLTSPQHCSDPKPPSKRSHNWFESAAFPYLPWQHNE